MDAAIHTQTCVLVVVDPGEGDSGTRLEGDGPSVVSSMFYFLSLVVGTQVTVI